MDLQRRQYLVAAMAVPWAAAAADTPPDLREWLPSATLSGSSRFTNWGFGVYDASLWVQPGFAAESYDQHGFALSLHYLRDFSGASIASHSIDEMRRQSSAPAQPWSRWQQSMREAFPDVTKGDRITGIHRPGEGADFLFNGNRSTAVRDPEFARLFFGIWLSDRTSEPGLRKALLAGVSG